METHTPLTTKVSTLPSRYPVQVLRSRIAGGTASGGGEEGASPSSPSKRTKALRDRAGTRDGGGPERGTERRAGTRDGGEPGRGADAGGD